MFMSLLLDIVYALVYNLVLLILGIVAVVKAKNGKKAVGWLVAGALIQGVSIFGAISGMVRDPALWATTTNIFSMVGYVVLIIVFAVFIRKFKNRS